MTGRRGLTVAVLACGIAGAVALLAASRGWGTVTTPRPDPLPPSVTHRTGDSWVPALPALCVVAIAGAGALLALKGVLRKVIGGLLVATGLGCAAAAGTGMAEGAEPLWPVVAVLGGLVVAGSGVVTVRSAGTWPAMGARYENRARGRTPRQSVPEKESRSQSRAELWDALDRGEDPTA